MTERKTIRQAIKDYFGTISAQVGVIGILKEAGYTTVNQIASSESQDLLDKLLEANERASITKRPPTLSNIEKWIELAKTQLA